MSHHFFIAVVRPGWPTRFAVILVGAVAAALVAMALILTGGVDSRSGPTTQGPPTTTSCYPFICAPGEVSR